MSTALDPELDAGLRRLRLRGQAARGLADFSGQLQALLVVAAVVHFDETGGRMEGVLGWIHSRLDRRAHAPQRACQARL